MEATQALLTPAELLHFCCSDVGHERGGVLDPRVVPIVCLVSDSCSYRLPVEKVDGLRVEFAGDVDRRARLHFLVPQGEGVDSDLDFVVDGRDLIMCDGVVELIETLFCEEAVLPERLRRIFGARMKGRQDRITKTVVAGVLEIDHCMILGQEVLQLSELETGER